MLLHVLHRMRYRYPTAATESHSEVRLMPLTDLDQTCLDFRLTIEPPVLVSSYDESGGTVHRFGIVAPHTEMEIVAEARVETRRVNPYEALNLVEEDWAFYAREDVRQEFAPLLGPTELVPLDPAAWQIAQVARKRAGAAAASFLVTLTRLLYRFLTYDPNTLPTQASLTRLLGDRRGICQDFAHTMLAVCRCQGIPCRFVSGYLYGDAGVPTTHTDQVTHAWVECLLPGRSSEPLWCGFDPTNNLLANDRYVKAHWGRDFRDVAPTSAVYRGAEAHALDVVVDVWKER